MYFMSAISLRLLYVLLILLQFCTWLIQQCSLVEIGSYYQITTYFVNQVV